MPYKVITAKNRVIILRHTGDWLPLPILPTPTTPLPSDNHQSQKISWIIQILSWPIPYPVLLPFSFPPPFLYIKRLLGEVRSPQMRGCACCCWDTVEPWEARPSCSSAMALIFTKGLCRIVCLGRPEAGRTGAGCQGLQQQAELWKRSALGDAVLEGQGSRQPEHAPLSGDHSLIQHLLCASHQGVNHPLLPS